MVVWWHKLDKVEMSVYRIILASLSSFCQKLYKLVVIWRSSDKNSFAQFFETRCSGLKTSSPIDIALLSLSVKHLLLLTSRPVLYKDPTLVQHHISLLLLICALVIRTDNYIIRPRRSRSAADDSHQTFAWTICRSVCRSVCGSVQCIVEKRRIGSGCRLVS